MVDKFFKIPEINFYLTQFLDIEDWRFYAGICLDTWDYCRNSPVYQEYILYRREFSVLDLVNICSGGYLHLLKFYVESCTDLDSSEKISRAFLHTSYNGHLPVIRYLYTHFSKFLVLEKTMESCYLAITQGHVETVSFLFSMREMAEHSGVNDGMLRRAACSGNVHMMEFLISRGGDLTEAGELCLREAMRKGHLKMLLYILKLLEGDARLLTRVSWAVEGGNLQMVKWRFAKGVDMEDSSRAMLLAIQNGHCEIMKYLHFQNVSLSNVTLSDTTIETIVKIGNLEIVKFLYENEIDLYALYPDTLKTAVKYGHLPIVEFLIQRGADISAENYKAFRLAARWGHLHIVKFLHSCQEDITANNHYALRWAARLGYLDIAEFLVAQGSDIFAKNHYALLSAVCHCHLSMVEFLISKGETIQERGEYRIKIDVHDDYFEMAKYIQEARGIVHFI